MIEHAAYTVRHRYDTRYKLFYISAVVWSVLPMHDRGQLCRARNWLPRVRIGSPSVLRERVVQLYPVDPGAQHHVRNARYVTFLGRSTSLGGLCTAPLGNVPAQIHSFHHKYPTLTESDMIPCTASRLAFQVLG